MSYSYRSSKFSGPQRRPQQSRSGQRSRGGRVGQYIDPSRFVKAATMAEVEAYQPTHVFSDFALNDLLQTNLAAKGYTVPTPIQDQAISHLLEGKDVIGLASTGTGKTAAFGLPILHRLMTDQKAVALVIAPTRELAQQIEEEFRALGKGSGLTGALLIGGTGMGSQLQDLRQRPRIVVGTPGRIKDHLERGSLKLDTCNIIVLDEVDRMLDMGFVYDVTDILSNTNPDRQTLFFSATMDNRVRGLISNFSRDPMTLSLKAGATSENVHQNVVRYEATSDKIGKLHDLLLDGTISKTIIFDETQRSVERLGKELASRGFATETLHGGKTQGQRQRALSRFKKTEVNILVATDVAARGIDVIDVSHVINYTVPKDYDDYIHRIGRAGRGGQIGYALTFVAH